MASTNIIDMVLAIAGVDLKMCSDNFHTSSDGWWFVNVPYNGVTYRTVKVIGNAIEFYENHPTKQKDPNIRITMGVVGKEYPLTTPAHVTHNPVEFKGVHTRFEDSDNEESLDAESATPKPKKKRAVAPRKKKATEVEKGETSSRPDNISGMMGLKIYENKRKLLRVESVDDSVSRSIDNHLRKEMRAVTSDMSMGRRGELTFTFQTSSFENIPPEKTFVEFIVNDRKYYYSRFV
jgi:hypothetical protein